MKRRKDVSLYASVKFLRSSTTLETFTSLQTQAKTQTQHNGGGETGEEARRFYEQLLGETSQNNTINKLENDNGIHTRRKSIRNHGGDKKSVLIQAKSETNSTCDSRQANLFLKMAQDGDMDGLQRLFENGRVDINATDQFGWTALMCACHSGHKSCIRFLLKQGAKRDLTNNRGETAEDIAKKQHKSSVYSIFKKHARQNGYKLKASIEEPTNSFCEICNIQFTSLTTEHNSSTVHLFNCQHKSERTVYYIPETNIGFQLMAKTGWDKEKGLGPEGKGRKFPIKTILKQDRQGFGSKQKEKAKVTHFAPHDTAAVERKKNHKVEKRVPRRTSKRKLIEKEMKDKKWEQDMRIYMSTD